MNTESPTGIRGGIRLVSLWFALSIPASGFALVVDAALVDEPIGWPLLAHSLLAAVVAAVVHRRHPRVDADTVWRFALVSFAVLAPLALLTDPSSGRTEGTVTGVATALLAWAAALGVAFVVTWPGEVRELLSSA